MNADMAKDKKKITIYPSSENAKLQRLKEGKSAGLSALKLKDIGE